MATGRRINRQGPIPAGVLRSLAVAYADANRQAAALVRAYRRNTIALVDLQGTIEVGAAKADEIAARAQNLADRL